MTNQEEWKPVVGWEESHEVSNIGSVRSIPRKGCGGRILCPTLHKRGHLVVVLCYKRATTTISIHRLVLTTFCGNPPPDGKSRKIRCSIKHKDGNNLNNHVDNLQWLTIENSKAFAAGGRRKAKVLLLIEPLPPEGEPMTNPSQSPAHFRMAKATPEDISKLRDFLTKLESYAEEGIDNDEDFILDIMGDFEGVTGWRRVVEGLEIANDEE